MNESTDGVELETILLLIYLPLLVPSVILLYWALQFYRRRHLFPIVMRKPTLILTGALCQISYCFLNCISWPLSQYVLTGVFGILYSSMLFLFASIYLWRAWLLYFFSRLASEIVMRELDKNERRESFSSFFQKRRYLVQTRYFVMYEIALGLLHQLANSEI
jgi:hypothetical protein